MNLRDFLNYRTSCPLCKGGLTTILHSHKRQSIRLEDNRLLIIYALDGLKRNQANYKVGYSFGMYDNSWYAEFYNKDGKRFENDAPDFLRVRFKELDKNLGSEYKFCRYCDCRRYNYISNIFKLDYKLANIGDLSIHKEYFGMAQKLLDGNYKIYKLLNNYLESKSYLVFGQDLSDISAGYDWTMDPRFSSLSKHNLDQIQTSLIKFTNKEEIVDRLSKLIVFS
jgi:hypothetical protein